MDLKSLLDPNILSEIAMWAISSIATVVAVMFRLKTKKSEPAWDLTHRSGEYWELTRLHKAKAKIVHMSVDLCEAPEVVTPANFPAAVMSKGDSIMLFIRGEASGAFEVFFVTGRYKKNEGNELFYSSKPVRRVKSWSSVVWPTKI